MLLVRRGGLSLGAAGQRMGAAQLATFEETGGPIRLTATEADTAVLLLAGEPIHEPIAAREQHAPRTAPDGQRWDALSPPRLEPTPFPKTRSVAVQTLCARGRRAICDELAGGDHAGKPRLPQRQDGALMNASCSARRVDIG
eukprot:5192786-Prymnesium_polylepis.1